MRWDHALEAVNMELRASVALAAIIAPTGKWRLFKHTAPRTATIPHASLFFIAETYRESINDMLLQVSLFAYGIEQMIALERAVRDTIDRRVWSTVGGLYMRCELTETVDLLDPEEQVVHRALTFGLSLPRERYVGAEAS